MRPQLYIDCISESQYQVVEKYKDSDNDARYQGNTPHLNNSHKVQIGRALQKALSLIRPLLKCLYLVVVELHKFMSDDTVPPASGMNFHYLPHTIISSFVLFVGTKGTLVVKTVHKYTPIHSVFFIDTTLF